MSIVALSLALAGASAPAQSTDAALRSYVACAAKRNEVEVRAMLDARNEDAYHAAVSAMSLDFRCAAAWPIQGLIRHFRPELERRIAENVREAAE